MLAYIKNLINVKPILISYNIRMRIKNLWLNLSIYQKMMIGYMLIVFMVVLVSVYIIAILFRLNALSSTILSHDITSIDLKKRIINSLLSQDRTKENYLLLGDKIFLDSFNEKKREITGYLAALERLSDAQKEREEIEFFKKLYFEYININKDPIDIESQKIKSRNQIDDMIKAMEAIISYRENIINKKMESAKEIGGNAARLSIIISIIAFMFGITFAFLITKSISEPIERLKHETTNIARGDFNRKIEVASKDEIGGLAAAFNIMCHKLNELERLKSEFIANISHEFRTPLTSLKEANNLMLDGTAGKTTEKQQRLLRIIKEENEKLINMINHLLDLSKMEAGMVKYNFMPSDIKMVFENCVNEMRLLAERKNIDLRIEIKENLPIIMMDSEKIKLVMINLLSNALKFTPEGGTIIIRGCKDDSNMRVEVRDTGSGIPQDDINRIFDKFQQVDTAINRKQGGTGLGLSIARHIVDAHKGKIWAESKLGSGSIFTLLLPLRIT